MAVAFCGKSLGSHYQTSANTVPTVDCSIGQTRMNDNLSFDQPPHKRELVTKDAFDVCQRCRRALLPRYSILIIVRYGVRKHKHYQSCAPASRIIDHQCPKRDLSSSPNPTKHKAWIQSKSQAIICNPRAHWSRMIQKVTVIPTALLANNNMLIICCGDTHVAKKPALSIA